MRTGIAILITCLVSLASVAAEICNSDVDCPVGSLCEDKRCHAAICMDVYNPVCSADGRSFANACQAALAHAPGPYMPGTDCARDNGRSSAILLCGGEAYGSCPTGDVCQYVPGDCGEHDRPGICVTRPAACPRLLDQVCGCDGKTYSNPCEAARAGVSIRLPGECRELPVGVTAMPPGTLGGEKPLPWSWESLRGGRVVYGTGIVKEGTELSCWAITTPVETYSCTFPPNTIHEGDSVCYFGTTGSFSFCMQGTPLKLLWFKVRMAAEECW